MKRMLVIRNNDLFFDPRIFVTKHIKTFFMFSAKRKKFS